MTGPEHLQRVLPDLAAALRMNEAIIRKMFEDAFREALVEVLDAQNFTSADPNQLADVLLPLLFSNEGADASAKLQMLRQGFIPRATRFKSIVDARPVFNIKRDKVIKFLSSRLWVSQQVSARVFDNFG